MAAGLLEETEPLRAPRWLEGLRGELSDDRAHLAWELARAYASDENEADTLGALFLMVMLTLARGSTRIRLDDRAALRRRFIDQLGVSAEAWPPIEALLDRMLGPGGHPAVQEDHLETHAPLIVSGGYLYPERAYRAERALAATLRERLRRGEAVFDPGAIDRAVAEATESSPIAPEQRDAVASALRRRTSVIRGGPGTGKTTTVRALVRAWIALGGSLDEIALAAPTGKAAARLTDASAELSATTIHRLLGYSPSRGAFIHHRDSPIPARLVIVDEASMIDLFLMRHLVDAVAASSHLVLLGDADQLPSVDAGAVFRALGELDAVASTLRVNHRADTESEGGRAILQLAASIRDGALPDPGAPGAMRRLTEAAIPSSGVWLLEPDPGRAGAPATGCTVGAFLSCWYETQVRGSGAIRDLRARTWRTHRGDGVGLELRDGESLEPLFELSERARLLCVTRRDPRARSVRAVNAILHRRFAPDERIAIGEPVMVTRNDHARELFNGQSGLVLWTASSDRPPSDSPSAVPQPSVVFRQGARFIAHPLMSVLGLVELAYAITVHRAQGSEHDTVALLVPELDLPSLWSREILYTAVTRARRAVILVGSERLLRLAAVRRVRRETGFVERLGGRGVG